MPLEVLFDECVDARLAASLTTVDVRTVADRGWVGYRTASCWPWPQQNLMYLLQSTGTCRFNSICQNTTLP